MVYFTRRYIDVTFIGPTTVKLTRHRVSARIRVGGNPGFGTAEVTIYGMTLSLMNQLATFGKAIHPQYDYNLIVEAGDDINGMNLVFQGTIGQAWADFQSAPDVPFHAVCVAGLYQSVQRPDQAWNSYDGPTDVATMMQNLASQMGLKFENNDINVKLDNPYHAGSPLKQAQQIAKAANIEMIVENGVLAIWPIDKTRSGEALYLSPQTGMVSYPTFTEYGVLVKSEFKKPVKYGSQVTIQSDLKPACKTWSIRLLDYDLQSLTPKGHWFMSMGCMDAKYNGALIINGTVL